jgi:acyl dehydratase
MKTVEEYRQERYALMMSRPKSNQPEYKAHVEKERAIVAEAVALYAKPQVSDCDYCKEVSIFGGPGHFASGSCRSGRRAHCTCDTCF